MQTSKPDRLDGYRALFDPYYVPPVLVGRKKESSFLNGFLLDNLALKHGRGTCDNLGTAIMVNGLRGIGKATLVRKVLNDFCTSQAGDPRLLQVATVQVNCHEKDESQLLSDIVAKLDIDAATVDAHDTARTWDAIAGFLRKQSKRTAYNLFFNNVECVPLKFFNKLASNLKGLGLNLLMATSMRHNNFFIDNLDMSMDLDVYNIADLNEIVDQRARAAFPGLNSSASKFITDAVVAFDSARPGPCIAVMKHLYPRVQSGTVDEISLNVLQESVKNALPEISYNELELAEFFANASIQKVIFLDNVIGHHETSGRFYITKAELQDVFNLSCESLEMEPRGEEFNDILADMLANNIFLKSNHQPNSFFSMIPARLIKGYIDVTLN